MPASPDFGVDFEPMVFGNAAPATPEPSEAQGRVIDGVPARPKVDRISAAIDSAYAKHTAETRANAFAALAPTAAELKRQLRARLRVVNAEIRLRAKLERERDTLLRLLAAADNKTPKPSRADVRPIRNVAG